jgi:hypothetical protein
VTAVQLLCIQPVLRASGRSLMTAALFERCRADCGSPQQRRCARYPVRRALRTGKRAAQRASVAQVRGQVHMWVHPCTAGCCELRACPVRTRLAPAAPRKLRQQLQRAELTRSSMDTQAGKRWARRRYAKRATATLRAQSAVGFLQTHLPGNSARPAAHTAAQPGHFQMKPSAMRFSESKRGISII